MTSAHHVATFASLGSTATLLVTDAGAGADALKVLEDELAAIDLAASRFRSDSELMAVNAAPPNTAVRVSPLMLEAVLAGLRAAEITDGLVDPTVGQALELIGYDRDFASVASDGPALTFTARPVPGWKCVAVDRANSTIRMKSGVRLDLGATAKALCSDRAAKRIADDLGVGVLVSLGGDIAVAGPYPGDGWSIKISHDHGAPLDAPGPAVDIRSGGLATSSTTVRNWKRGDETVHHLIDPRTSQPAEAHWTVVSVAAGTCLDANIASCASIVMGARAAGWLDSLGLPARLETVTGDVKVVGGWPSDPIQFGSVRPQSMPC